MWSGPRNISTALLRSWENRPDTFVCDEPLYAHYLAETGLDHPGADEIQRRQETDWRKVVAGLVGPVPGGAALFYQKHMAHHLLPHIGRDWLEALEHVFLIRDPREMLLSLQKVTPDPTLADTGLPQQVELFDAVAARTGRAPLVLDAKDVLQDPEAQLSALCDTLGIEFLAEMLRWPAGSRSTDGVWAPYWYASVERSTGFEAWRPREEALPAALEPVLAAAREPYATLHERRLRT